MSTVRQKTELLREEELPVPRVYGLCYVCGASVTPETDGIEWRGDPVLYFHPRCAVHFGLRFMRDVWELDVDESLSYPRGRGEYQSSS